LCGRGALIASYSGNKQFHQILEGYRLVYARSRFKQEKRLIAQTIVDEISKLGGRFLKKKDDVISKKKRKS